MAHLDVPATAAVEFRKRAARVVRHAAGVDPDEAVQAAAQEEKERLSFLEWAKLIPTAKGNMLDFFRFPYQPEIYEAFGNPEVEDADAMKSTQVGLSELMTRLALYLSDQLGATSLYVFPALKQMWEFCVAAHEHVLMASGGSKPISEVQAGDRVLTSDGDRVVEDEVTKVWARGRRRVLKVRLEGGRAFEVTSRHRVWTPDGWMRAGKLRPGDQVSVPRRLPEPASVRPLDVDDAFLLAVWLAEGEKARPGYTFTCGLPEIRDRVRKIAAERGWDCWEGKRLRVSLTCRWSKGDHTPAALLRRYGVRGMTTETIHVPVAVFEAQREAVEEFFGAYIACDGCVGTTQVSAHSVSERMVRDLNLLAARLDIDATVGSGLPSRGAREKFPNAKRIWALRISGLNGQRRMAEIGVPGKPVVLRSDQSEYAIEAFARAQEARRLRATTDLTLAEVGTHVGLSKSAVSLIVRGERHLRPRQRTSHAGHMAVVPHESGETGWSQVVLVEDGGVVQTFDLETKRHHSFFLESVLTHNSSTRVDPLREGSPYLQSRTQLAPRWAWNKGLKRIGTLTKSGFIHYRGSESKNELIAVDADAVFLDEYDSLAPQNVPEAERRIGGSSLGVIRRVGVPSHPEFGIAKRYDTSDKRSWQVKCGHCNEWQPLVFHKNVKWDEDEGGAIVDPRVVCWRCEEPLDVLSGEWVAEYPSRARPGFHVHRLMVPGDRNLRNVVEASKLRLPIQVKSFWNNDLGLPYTDATGGLDRAVLAAAISMAETWNAGPMYQSATPGYRGTNFVTMGVDVASARALNVRISEHIDGVAVEGHRKRALYIGTADSFDEVVELMERYQVTICVIDHLPEMRLALGVAERFPGRVYVCRYNTGGKQIDPLVLDTEQRTVSVLRVPLMDATAAVMRSLRNLIPEDLPNDYVDNMLAPRREIKKDEYDRVTVIWESKGPDDYYQAEAYDIVATEVLKVRIEVEEAERPELHALDEMLEFRRSGVADQDNTEYRPGPSEEGVWGDDMTYRPGPGE